MATAGTQIFTEEELMANESFHVDIWQAEGAALRAKERDLAKSITTAKAGKLSIQWEYGDWMLHAERAYAAKKIKKREWKDAAKRATGYAFGTLENMANVARSFEPSRRVVRNLPFSIFQELVKFKDQKIQEELLDLAEKGERQTLRPGRRPGKGFGWTKIPMSLRELQYAIQTRQESGKLPGPYEPKFDKHKGQQVLKIWLRDEVYQQLETWARAKYTMPKPASMLAWMASEYVKEHKPDLDAMVAAAEAAKAKAAEETRNRIAEIETRTPEEWKRRSEDYLRRREEFENYLREKDKEQRLTDATNTTDPTALHNNTLPN